MTESARVLAPASPDDEAGGVGGEQRARRRNERSAHRVVEEIGEARRVAEAAKRLGRVDGPEPDADERPREEGAESRQREADAPQLGEDRVRVRRSHANAGVRNGRIPWSDQRKRGVKDPPPCSGKRLLMRPYASSRR